MTTILVVEDNINVRITLEAVLRQMDMDIVCCNNAQEALSACESHSVDFIITDIVMPGMNGIELSQRIRKNYPDIHILAISGGGYMDKDETSPLEQIKPFVDATLEKPFSAEELKARLHELNII